MLRIQTAVVLATLALAMTGCAKSSRSVSESTLSGTAALSTYPTAARSVVATDERGRATTINLARDGGFTVKLQRGHTYRLSIVTDAATIPIVFPRASGVTTRTFSLKSDGARLSLGSVSYQKTLPVARQSLVRAGAIHVMSASVGEQSGEDNDDQDDNDVQCEDGSKGKGHRSADMESSDHIASGSGEVAVGEHNVPENVDGCGDEEEDGENNDDDGENEQDDK